jgi:hypothetical protein
MLCYTPTLCYVYYLRYSGDSEPLLCIAYSGVVARYRIFVNNKFQIIIISSSELRLR